MTGRAVLRTTLGALLACAALSAGAAVFAAPLGQEGAPGESNLGYLFAGFAVVWVGVIAYLFSISKREQSLRRELHEVRQRVDERKKEAQA